MTTTGQTPHEGAKIMGTVSRLDATDEIRNRREFKGSNFYATAGSIYTYPGHLPAEWHDRFKADAPTYVIYSYATPIGWISSITGDAVVPDVSYSVTTSAHQSITATALLGRAMRRTMLNVRPLSEIAREILTDWSARGKGVHYTAEPYLRAMLTLDTLSDSFYDDTAGSVVAYFLSNASTWRGDVAKRVKAELRDMQRCYR